MWESQQKTVVGKLEQKKTVSIEWVCVLKQLIKFKISHEMQTQQCAGDQTVCWESGLSGTGVKAGGTLDFKLFSRTGPGNPGPALRCCKPSVKSAKTQLFPSQPDAVQT